MTPKQEHPLSCGVRRCAGTVRGRSSRPDVSAEMLGRGRCATCAAGGKPRIDAMRPSALHRVRRRLYGALKPARRAYWVRLGCLALWIWKRFLFGEDVHRDAILRCSAGTCSSRGELGPFAPRPISARADTAFSHHCHPSPFPLHFSAGRMYCRPFEGFYVYLN